MTHQVMTRPKGIGTGWMHFGEPVKAENLEQACQNAVPENDGLWPNNYAWQKGTPEHPFVVCGGDIEICAVVTP